MHGTHKVK
jgi:hypothetical protein